MVAVKKSLQKHISDWWRRPAQIKAVRWNFKSGREPTTMIVIDAIKFNHDPNGAKHDGLNLRRNAASFISVPEWRRLVSINPEDSRAAYAVAATKGKKITIQVSLSSSDPSVTSIEVRARRHVKSRRVKFVAGKTGFVSFELIDPPVRHGRVGIWDVEWHWEFRRSKHHRWHHLDTTRHRIYVVLGIPTAPWKQMPYNAANTQLPWTDVLDYACGWAGGHAPSTKRRHW
jgi:hypothetical protein